MKLTVNTLNTYCDSESTMLCCKKNLVVQFVICNMLLSLFYLNMLTKSTALGWGVWNHIRPTLSYFKIIKQYLADLCQYEQFRQ